MVDTFNPLTIPAVMPATVRRWGPNGAPSQALLDYEQALQSWMRENTTAINTRFNTVESETGDTAAEVTEIIQALTDGTGAYGSYITTVATRADGASAEGAVFLVAKSAPTGAAAAYGWYIQADGSFAGMEALALSGGGSAIGFTADKFLFTDSGTATAVLSYSAGKWRFTSDVEVDGDLIIHGSVTSLGVAQGFSTRGSTNGTASLSTGSSGWTDLGSPLVLTIEPDAVTGDAYPLVFIRDSGTASELGGSPAIVSIDVRLLMNGVAIYTRGIFNTALGTGNSISDGITDFFETSSAGSSHTFQLQYQYSFSGTVSGSVFAKVMVLMISR